MIMYKLQANNDMFTGVAKPPVCVIRTTDNAVIPFDPANTDYQTYLKWVAQGNTPQPAGE